MATVHHASFHQPAIRGLKAKLMDDADQETATAENCRFATVAGRGYLQAVRNRKDATMHEIQIDVPLALKSTIAAATWPLAALKEFTGGQLLENDSKVTVSPR